MELLQLEYFLRVARSGNVSQTAAEINVAQSSVSRSIARLEESLGFPLFERVGRKDRTQRVRPDVLPLCGASLPGAARR